MGSCVKSCSTAMAVFAELHWLHVPCRPPCGGRPKSHPRVGRERGCVHTMGNLRICFSAMISAACRSHHRSCVERPRRSDAASSQFPQSRARCPALHEVCYGLAPWNRRRPTYNVNGLTKLHQQEWANLAGYLPASKTRLRTCTRRMSTSRSRRPLRRVPSRQHLRRHRSRRNEARRSLWSCPERQARRRESQSGRLPAPQRIRNAGALHKSHAKEIQ
jgi:hypothetical protein